MRFPLNVIKLFLAILILSGLMTPVYAQRRANRNARSKAKNTLSMANQRPVINSFTASSLEVVSPCPWFPATSGCAANGTCTIVLSTRASDLDGDALLYRYSVTGGQIVGEGPNVSWNLAGLSP
jgi:hypothetical protein